MIKVYEIVDYRTSDLEFEKVGPNFKLATDLQKEFNLPDIDDDKEYEYYTRRFLYNGVKKHFRRKNLERIYGPLLDKYGILIPHKRVTKEGLRKIKDFENSDKSGDVTLDEYCSTIHSIVDKFSTNEDSKSLLLKCNKELSINHPGLESYYIKRKYWRNTNKINRLLDKEGFRKFVDKYLVSSRANSPEIANILRAFEDDDKEFFIVIY